MAYGTRASLLNPLSLQQLHRCGDPLADAVAMRLEWRRPGLMLEEVRFLARSQQVEHRPFRDFVEALWDVPDWVDWPTLEHGCRLQQQWFPVRMLALYCYGMPLGLCHHRGEVALRTPGHLEQEMAHRLQESRTLMIRVLHHTDSLQAGYSGHSAVVETRLANALKRKKMAQHHWHFPANRLPINQTCLAFDMLEPGYLTSQGVRQLGFTLAPEDEYAISHFWRYCAHLYGVDGRLLWDEGEEGQQQQAGLYTELLDELSDRSSQDHQQSRRLLIHTLLRCLHRYRFIQLPKPILTCLVQSGLASAELNSLLPDDDHHWKRLLDQYCRANRHLFAFQAHTTSSASLSRHWHRAITFPIRRAIAYY